MHKGRVHNPANTDSCSSSRRTSMDSLAAAAMAVAANEHAVERKIESTATETSCRTEALGAQALLEAARFFGKAEDG